MVRDPITHLRISLWLYEYFLEAHTIGKVINVFCCYLQFWDTRRAACVLTVADNEDFISDMACDAEKRTLLATRYNENKQYQFIHCICNVYNGRIVASWLACSSLDQAVWVRALARDILLWSWAGYLTLTVPNSPPRCMKILANLLLGMTLWWTSVPSRGE